MAIIVTVLAALASWFDLRRGIIPNRLLFPVIGVGLLLRITTDILNRDPLDIFTMMTEVILLFICLWHVYTTGGLGAGDCKLLLSAGVFLPAKQAVFVIVSSFFIAAAEIILFKMFCGIRKENKKIKVIHFAPAFFIAVLIGWL